MLGTIGIEALEINGFIGCCPEERVVQQKLILDLQVELDVSKCVISDQLEDTLNYVKLREICQETLSSKHFQLIESFAYIVMQMVFKEFPAVTRVSIKVRKPSAIVQAMGSTIFLSEYRKE